MPTDGNETMAADDNHNKETNDAWTWHVLLSRSRLPVTADSSDAVPIDPRLPKTTLGYLVEVYRIKLAEEQDAESRAATEEKPTLPCPWLAPPDDDGASQYPSFDAEAYEAWAERSSGPGVPYGALASALPACPLGAELFMLYNLRKIFEERLAENFCGLAQQAVENALLYLLDADWEKKFSGRMYGATCLKETGLADLLQSFGSSGEDWAKVVSKRPERIVFHVPDEDKSSLSTSLREFCREKLPGVEVQVDGPPSKESPNWVTRTMAALDINNHYMARMDMLHQGPVPADFWHGRDCVDCGSEAYWSRGEPMRHLPKRGSREFRNLKSSHINACKLLALRPWSKLKRFEVLKVTVKHCNGGPETKYVFFSGNDGGEADSTSSSPFGYMQLLEDKSHLDFCFGRTSMYLQSGICSSNSNPDRVFLSAESYTEVHYDAIALLEHLFGDALVPDQLLPRGIIPLFEGQTGPMFTSSGTKGRRLTEAELGWLDGALPALSKFVEEESDRCVPSHGEQTRSYSVMPAPYGQDGSTHVVSGRASAVNIVTVSYNMDICNGGLWDPHRKWQWF